jgi:beta-lactamase class A
MWKIYLSALFFLTFIGQTLAQTTTSLREEIEKIISARKALIGVSINGNNGRDTLSVNGKLHFPMQSVYKFHIALAVLSRIDKGELSFDQKIKIHPDELLPNLYSPIRETYPNGAELAISEILKYTVSESDNVGCDVLLRLIGGPKTVDDYFSGNGFLDLSIKTNEEKQQSDWELQFQNWTTPEAANEVLASFYYNRKKLLSEESYNFIWKIMKETGTGKKRLKGQLPNNTIVAHKTGSSGTNKEGITAAVNDIGVVFFPNGQHYFISVFVTNSTENEETNEKIIADISKVTWDYFLSTNK